jgi:nitrile hydratase subunit beta
VSRINDVGGMTGFPAIIEEPDEPPFHADWEAHVFALNGALIRRGVYNLDEFRDRMERLPPEEYLAAPYYEKWFRTITALLAEKGVASAGELLGGASAGDLPDGGSPGAHAGADDAGNGASGTGGTSGTEGACGDGGGDG